MSDARRVILDKLYQNAADTALPSPPRYQPQHGWSREERLKRFEKMLKSVRGEVHRVTANSVQARVEQILEMNKASRLLCSEKVRRYFPKMFDGIERFHYDQPIENWKPALFKSIDASITTTSSCSSSISSYSSCCGYLRVVRCH